MAQNGLVQNGLVCLYTYWNDAILGVAGSRPDVGTANIYLYFTLGVVLYGCS